MTKGRRRSASRSVTCVATPARTPVPQVEPTEPKNSKPATIGAGISNLSDAREALENNDLNALGRYLRDDVASLLTLIADDDHPPRQEGTRPPGYNLDDEFEYETEDIRWALKADTAHLLMAFFGGWRRSCLLPATCWITMGAVSIGLGPGDDEGAGRRVNKRCLKKKSIRSCVSHSFGQTEKWRQPSSK